MLQSVLSTETSSVAKSLQMVNGRGFMQNHCVKVAGENYK